jgi:hypothetical protein
MRFVTYVTPGKYYVSLRLEPGSSPTAYQMFVKVEQ